MQTNFFLAHFLRIVLFLLLSLKSVNVFAQEDTPNDSLVVLTKDTYLNLERYKNENYQTPKLIGNPVPNVSFRTIEGDSISLRALEGKVVFINVFFRFCSPCIHKIPFLNRLAKDFQEEDVVFIALSSSDTSEDLKGLARYLEKRGRESISDAFIKIPASFYGEEGDAYRVNREPSELFNNVTKPILREKFLINSAPATFFVDKKGMIRFVTHGYDHTKYDYYDMYAKELKRLLAE